MILECVPPKRRLRLSVLPTISNAMPQWHLSHTETVSADGLPYRAAPQGKSLLLSSAPRGASEHRLLATANESTTQALIVIP